MDVLSHLYLGFSVALTPVNLLAALLGCLAGTAIGVLPGIGPVVGITLLLPMTYGMDPTTSIIIIAAIYYGSMYGGSTTSILINVPGEAASVVTCLDGYQMARKGKAGAALGISAIGSFIAGIFSIVGPAGLEIRAS
jgi:putative tricarboxylic transport membrane protein